MARKERIAPQTILQYQRAKYKELGLKDKLASMSEDEQYDLLATDGMLVKRPLLVGDDTVLVGFKEKEWQDKL